MVTSEGASLRGPRPVQEPYVAPVVMVEVDRVPQTDQGLRNNGSEVKVPGQDAAGLRGSGQGTRLRKDYGDIVIAHLPQATPQAFSAPGPWL